MAAPSMSSAAGVDPSCVKVASALAVMEAMPCASLGHGDVEVSPIDAEVVAGTIEDGLLFCADGDDVSDAVRWREKVTGWSG